MRILIKVAKWGIGALLGLVLLGVVVRGVTGVPVPSTISAEGLGRVGWRPMISLQAQAKAQSASRWLAAWVPGRPAMLTWAPRRGAFRVHSVGVPGGEAEFVEGIAWNASGFFGSPDHPYIVVSWDADGTERDHLYAWTPPEPRAAQFTAGDAIHTFVAFETGGRRVAYRVDPGNGQGGELRTIIPNDPDSDRWIADMPYAWNPQDWAASGDAFLISVGITNQSNRLLQLDVATGEFEPLLPNDADSVMHGSVQYDRAGDGVYFTSNRRSEFMHLRRLDLRTREEVVLTPRLPWDVTAVEQAPDGELLLIRVNEDGEYRYYTYTPLTAELRPIDLFDDGVVSMTLNPDGSAAIVNHTDPNSVRRGFVLDLETLSLEKWVGPEPTRSEVPTWRSVRYPTFDSTEAGRRLIPALVYPGVGDGARPVVIDIHGGPHSQATVRTQYTHYQKAGVTVITPNVRGSTGYGKSFVGLDNGRRRMDAVRDIGALLDWVARQPDMDATRVMLRGGSYGGFMVYASLVDYGARVRCARAGFGIADPVTDLENSGPLAGGGRPEWGDVDDPEMRAYLDSIAPLTNADRIRTPLLIVHGASDRRVSVTQSRRMVAALQDNGVPVAYLEASDEGHGFRKPANRLFEMVAEMQTMRECLLN